MNICTRGRLLIGLLGTAAIAMAFSTAPAAATIDPSVRAETVGSQRIEVLISMRQPTARLTNLPDDSFESRVGAAAQQLREQSAAQLAPVLELLQRRSVPHRSLWIVGSVWARVDAADLDALATLPTVGRIRSNHAFRSSLPQPQSVWSIEKSINAIEWGVNRVGAPTLWAQGFRGQGVVVGGQDTGYQWNHPALLASYRGWNGSTADHNYSWHDAIRSLIGSGSNPCGLNSEVPCDDHNHGTHTMGTMVGDDGGSNQVGVAPDARWIGCRNMERGNGTPATYLECFQWFLAPTDLAGNNPDPSRAPHVINNSWGCPPSEGCNSVDLFEQAVDQLRDAGILVVVSAGNTGSNCGSINTAPGPYPSSFTVGSTNISDVIASSSSRGPATVNGIDLILKPDISGPGVNVRSSIRGGGYSSFSGTSMAGPHVAAVAALLMSARPQLKGQPAALEALMKQSARPQLSSQSCGDFPGSVVPNTTYGHGIVDAVRALQLLEPILHDGFEG